ncbi:MAG: AraC family transcriptional regulator [Bacteroidota bacterium]
MAATTYTPDAPTAWGSDDPLGEVLHLLRMSGVFYTRSEFTEPWALALPALPDCLMFHVVTEGEAWLEEDGADPIALAPGALALVPHGEGHRLSSAPDIPAADLFDVPREPVGERYEILRHGGGGAPTTMVCGAVRFDHPAVAHLASVLPRRILVEASGDTGGASPERAWMQGTLALMAAEAARRQPGGEALITRLADVLVVQAVRTWLLEAPEAHAGWLGALRDPQVGRALLAVHRDPERTWTVEALAAEAAQSRSAFAARFAGLVGEPPMRYVTRWRMHVAATVLREEDATVVEVADRLGYASEAAFSRAFKRVVGVPPSEAREAFASV